MKAVRMGDFYGGCNIKHLDGTCWVCGVLVTRGRRYCNRHKEDGRQARAEAQRLVAYARRKRGRELCREWWEVTE